MKKDMTNITYEDLEKKVSTYIKDKKDLDEIC